MSSMRNAVQRRNHKERAQPAGREKWGILEKHKDYSLRARDYNIKKAKLQRLREKARDKNPDEFAFGMMSERSGKKGKHGARDTAGALSVEAVKLLKTQDAGYLRVVGERVRRQLEAAEKEVKLQDGMAGSVNGRAGGKKLVFVESLDEQTRRAREENDEEDEEEEEDEDSVDEVEHSQKLFQQKSKKQLEAEEQAYKEMRKARKLKRHAAESRYKKLEALRKQHEDMVAAELELDRQRAKMENSVGGVNKYGVKWKVRERKR